MPFKIIKAGAGNFSDEEVARHEAGHAIVGALLGLDVWCARLCEPGSENQGYTMFDGEADNIESVAMVFCGGAAASEVTGFSDKDFESITNRGFTEDQIEVLLQKTKELLGHNTQALEYCVELLLKHRWIFKDDIQTCVVYNQMYKDEYL